MPQIGPSGSMGGGRGRTKDRRTFLPYTRAALDRNGYLLVMLRPAVRKVSGANRTLTAAWARSIAWA